MGKRREEGWKTELIQEKERKQEYITERSGRGRKPQ